jgi:hypothetical protein
VLQSAEYLRIWLGRRAGKLRLGRGRGLGRSRSIVAFGLLWRGLLALLAALLIDIASHSNKRHLNFYGNEIVMGIGPLQRAWGRVRISPSKSICVQKVVRRRARGVLIELAIAYKIDKSNLFDWSSHTSEKKRSGPRAGQGKRQKLPSPSSRFEFRSE